MSLKDELGAALGQRRLPCRTRDLATTLDEEDRVTFLDAVENSNISLLMLSRVMTDRGTPISTDSLRKHRQKVCSCVAEG